MEFVYQDLSTYYIEEGYKKPFILLHGWGLSKETFKDLIQIFKETYKVYALDLIGFGQSDEPSLPLTLNDYVNHLDAFMKARHIEKPIILGHSFGARIAIKYVATTSNASYLILSSAAGLTHYSIKRRVKRIIYKLKRKYYRIKKDIIKFNKLEEKNASSDYLNASLNMKGTLSKVVNTDLSKYLKKITVPTLLIWGKKDKITPYSDARKMNKLISSSYLVTFDDCNHFPYLERTNDFVYCINKFLGETHDLS